MQTLYTDAESFFRDPTYPTEGLRLTLLDVFGRLASDTRCRASIAWRRRPGNGKTQTLIARLKTKDATLVGDPVLERWELESQLLSIPFWSRPHRCNKKGRAAFGEFG